MIGKLFRQLNSKSHLLKTDFAQIHESIVLLLSIKYKRCGPWFLMTSLLIENTKDILRYMRNELLVNAFSGWRLVACLEGYGFKIVKFEFSPIILNFNFGKIIAEPMASEACHE